MNNGIKFVIFILLLTAFFLVGRFFSFDQEQFKEFFSRFPIPLSSFIFVITYVILTFFIWIGPKDVLRIFAAVYYGPYLSTLLVYISELFNVVVLFNLSRKLGRGYVESRLKGKMAHVDTYLTERSFAGIFFLKFFPIIPLRFLDLGFGLTKISLKKYFVISALATPVRFFTLQVYLSLGADIFFNPQRFRGYLESHPGFYLFTAIYSFSSLIMLFFIGRKPK